MNETDRLKRWRLVLGNEPASCLNVTLSADEARMDEALESIYDDEVRKGGLGGSNPRVSRWLGDIRRYFSTEVVQVMQKDAIERLDLKRLLLEPEFLTQAEPDIHLVSTLISLNRIIPEKTRETARIVVRKLVDELLKKSGVAVSGRQVMTPAEIKVGDVMLVLRHFFSGLEDELARFGGDPGRSVSRNPYPGSNGGELTNFLGG